MLQCFLKSVIYSFEIQFVIQGVMFAGKKYNLQLGEHYLY